MPSGAKPTERPPAADTRELLPAGLSEPQTPPGGGGYQGDGERALRSTVVYTAATSLQRAIMFLLLPAFTFALSPAEYGRLSIALAIYAVASITFALGLDLAVFRMYVQLSDERHRQQHFIASIWAWLLLVPAVIAAVLMIPSFLLLDDQAFVTPVQMALTLFGAALYVAATTVPLAVLRAEQRLRPFVAINVVAATTTTALTVALVIGADEGVTGWLVAVVIANAITLLVALRALRFKRPSTIDRPTVVSALRFSLPLLPHTLAHWALQLADRLALTALVAAASVGIYGLAANLAMPLMIVIQSLNHGVQPQYAAAGKDPGRLHALSELVRVQVGIVALLTLAFALMAAPIVNLVVDDQYASSAELVPWIALGYGFLGLYCVPMNAAALIVGVTKRIWVLAVTGAIVNLGLIFWLVPNNGLIVAAIASAAGYGALMLGTYVFARAHGDPLDYPWAAIAGLCSVCLLSYFAGTDLIGASTALDAALRFAWLLGSGVLVVLLIGPRRITRLW